MIDFFESKLFNAASVGALTIAVSYCADMSTWATIGLALLAVGAFLLIFRDGRNESPMHAAAEAPRVQDGQSRILCGFRSFYTPKSSARWPAGGWRQAIAPPFLIEAPSRAFGAGDYRVIAPTAARFGHVAISHAHWADQWLPQRARSTKQRSVAHSTL